jgi:DNA polymerase-3 subunit delta'
VLFQKVAGHQNVKKSLARALEIKKPSHSYLFWGPEGVGKKLLALRFAQALACPQNIDGCGCPSCLHVEAGTHPDVHLIFPSGENIKIEEARHLIEICYLNPVASPWVVNIIDEADRLTPEASNSLLKLLEEPPPAVVNILVTSRPHFLPPTILSRCFPVPFGFLKREEIAEALRSRGVEQAELISRLASGRMGDAFYWAQEENWKRRQKYAGIGLQLASGNVSLSACDGILKEKDKRAVLDFLKVVLSLWRDLALLSTGISDIMNADQENTISSLASTREFKEWINGCFRIEEVLELSRTTVNMGMLLPVLAIELGERNAKGRSEIVAT